MVKKGTAQAEQITVEEEEGMPFTEENFKLLNGFAVLVSERFGYWMARRMTQQDMSEKLADESKAVREIRKGIADNIEKHIENPSEDLQKAIREGRVELDEALKPLNEKRKPFTEKMKPLQQAVRYLDVHAIPDSLKELGHQIAPRFTLSKWVNAALAQQKQKKKK